MAKSDDLFTSRKGLDEICSVPEKIISVYSLEKHVWADSNSDTSRRLRKPELQTVEEFRLDPVRAFLNDILRNMAAPYDPNRRENPIGQGYWIQAEFGSGKSHLLCFLAALALGSKEAWDLAKKKEEKAGRGKRESVYRFWEEGLQAKSGKGKKGVFVVVKTLVGAGGGALGVAEKGRRLGEYILDAVKDQLQVETGKNLSLYPVELLADRFLKDDVDLYRAKLKKFLKDPNYFSEDEFEEVDDFIRDIQQNKSPEYKRSCGNKLWRFYTEYLKVQPHIAAESEDILKHMVETVLAEGYAGMLLVLDEVSLFMKNRDDDQRADDEKTLVVLSNRLGKIHNLPIWTVCAAQQQIESKMGVKNIIADDRLKLVKLLEEDKDYYDIVLNRVREMKDQGAVTPYYLHYKRGFSWPATIGEPEFTEFFPFHKPALEVLRAVTYELTTTRSAIHFMHQTLRHQVKEKGRELIRLWELFDEAVRYEEDPSGVHAGLVAIKTKKETEYRAYEAAKKQIDGLTRGILKVHRDKAIKTLQTLFLYHVSKTRQQGITGEDIANAVMIERDAESNVDENVQHYETIAENLKKELRQIAQSYDDDKRARYRFDPVFTGIDPRDEFRKAKDEAESNKAMQQEAWEHLLALDEWPVRTRQMTIDLSGGVKSIFRDIAPFVGPWEDRSSARAGDQDIDVNWQGRQVIGLAGMRDLARVVSENGRLPAVESDQSDRDFCLFVSSRRMTDEQIGKLVDRVKDPRVLFWTPDELRTDERSRLIEFAAYRKLVEDWRGKETEDAVGVINWVSQTLSTEMGKIYKIVPDSYARGRIDAANNSQMEFHVAGELTSIISPLVDRVLTAAYESREIKFDGPYVFKKEEGVKVINGIVRVGEIPKGSKPNQNISAADNFGYGLMIMKKSAQRKLDCTGNRFVDAIWSFIDEKLVDDGQTMKIETLYKNFMGIGGPKDFGLTRRMVQIFLLCLAKEGRIRVGLSGKSGLSHQQLDYATLGETEFTAAVLGALVDVQKMARPENWEVLRPYAEKLLEKEIPITHDDSVISEFRKQLKELFERRKEEGNRLKGQAQLLFDELGTANPYERELEQVAKFFAADLSSGNDINLILFALKDAFGYTAFDENRHEPKEVDDLANRLRNYADLQRFIGFQQEVRTAHAYCSEDLADVPALKSVKSLQRKVQEKLANLTPYIDSELTLKTELIGKTPPESGETGTLGCLIAEYMTAYATAHDRVVNEADAARTQLKGIVGGDPMSAFKTLEGITALQPAVTPQIEESLVKSEEGLFACPAPSRASVDESLKRGPRHVCDLTIAKAETLRAVATAIGKAAQSLFDQTLEKRLGVLLASGVQDRLQQGAQEPLIAAMLKCSSASELRDVLVPAALKDPDCVNTINKYLKKIVVAKVNLSEFQPSLGNVERDQIPALVAEFQAFVESRLKSIESGDVVAVLQIEQGGS
jgi:hypothetical protein